MSKKNKSTTVNQGPGPEDRGHGGQGGEPDDGLTDGLVPGGTAAEFPDDARIGSVFTKITLNVRGVQVEKTVATDAFRRNK